MENRIREAIGIRPLGFRAPYRRFSNHALNLFARREYTYDSSFMDSDDPYTINIDGRILVESLVERRLDDRLYLEVSRVTPKKLYEMWLEEIDYAHRRGGYLSLTIHNALVVEQGLNY